jgi:predicted ATP-dependent Lon-type protease
MHLLHDYFARCRHRAVDRLHFYLPGWKIDAMKVLDLA